MRQIRGFWQQKNISKNNIARLTTLAGSETPEVAELAQVVLEATRIWPFRKKRLGRIAKESRPLIDRLEGVGLIYAWVDYEDASSDEACPFDEGWEPAVAEAEDGLPFEADDPGNYDYYLPLPDRSVSEAD